MAPREGAFDAIVIGAGSAGLTVAVGLAGLGRRVALVEAGRIGGDCTNVGCVPSKRLIHLARDPAHRSDPDRLLAAVRATRDALAAREDEEIPAAEGIELIRGRARLGAGRRVTVSAPEGTRRVAARHVVIATGSRPRALAIPGLPPERTLTNESLFEQARAPEHLAIVGAGPIGVEMACAFARMGTAVSLIDVAPRVLPQASKDASATLARALAEQGVGVRVGHRVTGYDPQRLLLDIAGRAASSSFRGWTPSSSPSVGCRTSRASRASWRPARGASRSTAGAARRLRACGRSATSPPWPTRRTAPTPWAAGSSSGSPCPGCPRSAGLP